jgi:predicted transcriptional regulator
MSLLELPNRHHALHVLGVLVHEDEKRFGELVKTTGHRDAEIARALDFLKTAHYIRAKTLKQQGKKIILAYSATARGKAAWEAFEAYRDAIRARATVLGRQDVRAVENVLQT